jgi:hypothetical protein
LSLSYATAVTGTYRQVSILPNPVLFSRCAKLLGFCGLFLACLPAYAVSSISISAYRVEHPQFDAQNLKLDLALSKTPVLAINTQLKAKADKDWAQFNANCQVPAKIQTGRWSCPQGQFKTTRTDIPFNLQIERLFSQGVPDLIAAVHFNNAKYGDEAGLHAIEQFTGDLNIHARQLGEAWLWETALDWQKGEVFWQPFYVPEGGHQFTAKGRYENDLLNFESTRLTMNKVGALDLDGQIRISDLKLINLKANLPSLNLTTAYPLLFKPLLEKTAFNNADMEGKVSLKIDVQNSEVKTFDLSLNDVNVADNNQKFAFYKLNAHIPWDYDAAKQVSLSYESGELLDLPLGETLIKAEVNRYAVTTPNIRLPILDGALNLSDISAARVGEQWVWHLRAKIEPISMADLSSSLKLPRMEGLASAEIPLVTYHNGMVTTDGNIKLNIFNGVTTISQLILQDPLGNAPKLNADITMRHLDLGDLTRTFSFGAIEGKLDADIAELQLQNWKPVNFDAVIKSSPGKYPKKISQRAVENISALGGAGAAAAVQRSVLRFFEEFNYDKIGLNCKLRKDVCYMSGVESTPQGYVIVKGRGIPAITVMGYNQTVGWSDLIDRIKRVTDSNAKPIIK